MTDTEIFALIYSIVVLIIGCIALVIVMKPWDLE
jgi:hypothetical protein